MGDGFPPSPGGVRDERSSLVGRLTLSAAKCETGWGDSLSTRALFETRDRHPTPPLRGDPPPPGEGESQANVTDWTRPRGGRWRQGHPCLRRCERKPAWRIGACRQNRSPEAVPTRFARVGYRYCRPHKADVHMGRTEKVGDDGQP